jgi:hypothetical protein
MQDNWQPRAAMLTQAIVRLRASWLAGSITLGPAKRLQLTGPVSRGRITLRIEQLFAADG